MLLNSVKSSANIASAQTERDIAQAATSRAHREAQATISATEAAAAAELVRRERAIHSDVALFFPLPKGRKQAGSHIDWAFKTSNALIA